MSSKTKVEGPKEAVRSALKLNSNLTPGQVQNVILRAKVKEEASWEQIENCAKSLLDRKWISNEKASVRTEETLLGNFEALITFKSYTDKRDEYYIFKINDGRGNPDVPCIQKQLAQGQICNKDGSGGRQHFER